MPSHVDEIAEQALKLPMQDRAELAHRLTSSLDEDVENEGEIHAMWIAEAKRRLDEMRCGAEEGIDGETAIRKARELLAE